VNRVNPSNHRKVALITGSGRRRVGNIVARALAQNGECHRGDSATLV
jgi:NAD(P)-dependent dehydrogenase (short-subunit alcohol dehydrogenase family)